MQVQVAELLREHAGLVLIHAREERAEELDARVTRAQPPEKTPLFLTLGVRAKTNKKGKSCPRRKREKGAARWS